MTGMDIYSHTCCTMTASDSRSRPLDISKSLILIPNQDNKMADKSREEGTEIDRGRQ